MRSLTKTGNSLALVLDRPVLAATGIGPATTVEVSTDGDVIVVAPVRPRSRTRKGRLALEVVNACYAGVFKRLAE